VVPARFTLVTAMKALPGEVRAITVDVDRWPSALPPGERGGGELKRRGFTSAPPLSHVEDVLAPNSRIRGEALRPRGFGFGVTGYGRRRTRDVLDQDPDGSRLAISIEGTPRRASY
jgi:hypothetical protein